MHMNKKLLLVGLLIFGVKIQAQSLDPLRTKDAKAQEKWVDSIMGNMTVDEKIGQLFMVQAYSNKDEKHTKEIVDLLKKYHVGSLIFMQGTPEKQAVLTNTYQAVSKVPLLIAIAYNGVFWIGIYIYNRCKIDVNS